MAEQRLIDANEVICGMAEIMKSPWFNDDKYSRLAKLDSFHIVKNLCIDSAPTIDAVPVVHGRWEWHEDWGPSTWLEPPDLDKVGWKCSNCGIDLGDYLTDCLGVTVYVDEEDKMPKIKSCPNCGAKMDGGAD